MIHRLPLNIVIGICDLTGSNLCFRIGWWWRLEWALADWERRWEARP